MVLHQQVQKKLHPVEERLPKASMDKVLWSRGEGESLRPHLRLLEAKHVMQGLTGKSFYRLPVEQTISEPFLAAVVKEPDAVSALCTLSEKSIS